MLLCLGTREMDMSDMQQIDLVEAAKQMPLVRVTSIVKLHLHPTTHIFFRCVYPLFSRDKLLYHHNFFI